MKKKKICFVNVETDPTVWPVYCSYLILNATRIEMLLLFAPSLSIVKNKKTCPCLVQVLAWVGT
jgi:hypothetical protein